jgi:hypothetical protein
MKVDGIAVRNEFRMPRLNGKSRWFQAVKKLPSVGWNSAKFHHPNKISSKGLIEVIKTLKNGIIQMRAADHAIMWTITVVFRIFIFSPYT